MHRIILLLVVTSLPGSLWAADPIIGTWKLNVEKSTLMQARQESSKESMEVYREIENGEIEMVRSPSGTVVTWPKQGGIALSTRQSPAPSTEGNWLVQTLVAPGEWYVTYIDNHKQIGFIHKVVSNDGKTMTQTMKFADDQGGFTEQVRVYERQ
jgi:hypothetical protein